MTSSLCPCGKVESGKYTVEWPQNISKTGVMDCAQSENSDTALVVISYKKKAKPNQNKKTLFLFSYFIHIYFKLLKLFYVILA